MGDHRVSGRHGVPDPMQEILNSDRNYSASGDAAEPFSTYDEAEESPSYDLFDGPSLEESENEVDSSKKSRRAWITPGMIEDQSSLAGRESAEKIESEQQRLFDEINDQPAESGWRGMMADHLGIKLPPSKSEIQQRKKKASEMAAEKEVLLQINQRLWQDIRRPLNRTKGGCGYVSMISLKGGVGKTTVSSILSHVISGIREESVVVMDVDPNYGTIHNRLGVNPVYALRDLVANNRYASSSPQRLGEFVGQVPGTEIAVVKGDMGRANYRPALDQDVKIAASLFHPYFSIGLLDNGSGLFHPSIKGSLDTSMTAVLVADNTRDSFDVIEAALEALNAGGHHDIRQRVILAVVNRTRPFVGHNDSEEDALTAEVIEQEFRDRAEFRAVVSIPFDPVLNQSGPIQVDSLRRKTLTAFKKLAAFVIDDLS